VKILNGWKDDDRDLGMDWVLNSVGPGWADILTRLVNDLEVLGWNGQLCQVKEKFGGLRFYINAASEPIWKRISQAEHESYKICETCGQPGKLRRIGWWKTLCDEHVKVEGKYEDESASSDLIDQEPL
jgi:hypothetical protein